MVSSLRRADAFAFLRARVIPTFGSPGTLHYSEALDVFWGDREVFIDVGKPCDLKAPKLQVWGQRGLLLEVDGAEDLAKCDRPGCGYPMRRDGSLDEPIKNCDGVWQGYRCMADREHVHLEPVD